VGDGAFFVLSCSRVQSQNKSPKAQRKKIAKKAKALGAKEKSAKEKSVNSRFFLPSQWKSSFRAQSCTGGGKKGS
jgi:hypothetical protein